MTVAATTTRAAPDLATRLEALQGRLRDLDAASILAVTIREAFPGRIACVSSFGAESVVLLHLLAQVDPATPVLFLNTGKLFGETMRYRDRLQEILGLQDVRAIGPDRRDLMRVDPDGVLWRSNADACCRVRKVLPLQRALSGFDAEITGRKRFQTVARRELGPIEMNGTRVVVNPLWNWSVADLQRHVVAHNLPAHPLVADGFVSIGCMPCTSRVKEGQDYRAGRWAGSDKDECGIHANIDGDGI